MSLSVDQLLAESSSDEEGPASSKDGALGDKPEAKKEGACTSRAPTLAEALAQADFSEDEDELGPPQQQRDPEAAARLGPEGSSRLGTVPSEGRVDDASDGSQAKTGQMVGLDELLAMDSETSSEGGKTHETQPRQLAATTEDGVAPPERQIADGTTDVSGQRDQMEEFLEAPFTWSSEHERSLLFAPSAAHGHSADFNDLGPGEKVTVAQSAAEVRPPQLVEVKPSSELRRQLAQEIGLPTCVAASSKVVAVGTLRGSVALLDQRLQDLSPKPQVLTLGEETSAVTAAAFSQDGGSLLVGHKAGHVVLWDLAAPKIACMVQELHSSAVISLAFCRPSWQYALSADAKGCVYFVTFFTGTFGRLDFEKQLLIEQSSNIGVALRVLPLLQVSTQTHPADARCLVGLCASNATVLLTLHPSAQVVQKMQYNAKDASWVPDAAWLRRESQEIAEPSQADSADPQLCVAYGQTIHLMRVMHAERDGKEEFQVSVVGRFSWGSPLRGLIAFTDSVLAILDASGRLSVVQLPDTAGLSTSPMSLSAVHTEDVTHWSLVFHTSQEGKDIRSHHNALAVFRGRARTLYVCGMKEVWCLQIARWGQHIESLVSRNDWSAALNVFLGLHRGFLPPLLDFPHQAALRQRAVELRTTQVIQSYLVNTLRPDADRSKVREICLTAVSVCVQAQLWPVLHKTVFECFKATGHMHVYCASLEPFILDARIPRAEMDSEVLSSILQSYTLPLQEEEVEAAKLAKDSQGGPCFVDCDHFPELFPVARRLQQLVLCVDVAKLDLNLAIRLFTQHRLWTALVHVYCVLGDYVTPLELLVGECAQLAKACTPACACSEEAPLLQCRLVRKLFFFLHQCFELRPFPLDSKDVAVPPSAITDLLACIFKVPPDPSQKVPPMFQRLLRLSSLGLFRTLSLLFTSPSGSRAVHQGDWSGQEDSGLESLFHLIRSSLDAVKENSPLSAHTQKEYLWFVARSVPRAKPQLSVEEVTLVVDHLLSRPLKGRRQRSEAEQLLIGVLATQDFDNSQLDAIIVKAMTDFLGLAAWLHERRGEFGKALDCRLQEPELREQIFEYIITKLDEVGAPLVEATLQRLQELVDVDKERCSLMLCEQFATADHALVLERLRQFPQMEMNYFEALFSRRFGLADRQAFFNEHVVHYIDLLCQNCPESVLPFILENEALPLRECLELCSRYGVTDASVHLLERTGDFAGVLQLVLNDCQDATEKLCVSFAGQGTDRSAVSKAVKRLLNGAEGPGHREAWYEGFPEAQKCMKIFQNAYELTSRNSNIMTEAQLEELWFGILGLTVRKQESLHGGCIGGFSERRRLALGLALQELASKAMSAVLAYLSLPRCLKWMCAEFGQSTLATWKGPLQSMLSGLGFQQGLLKAATAVAAQDVMRPFIALKVCGSRGALMAPRHDVGDVRIPLVSPAKALREHGKGPQ